MGRFRSESVIGKVWAPFLAALLATACSAQSETGNPPRAGSGGAGTGGASAGTVLGRRASGDMNVDVVLVVIADVDFEVAGLAAQVAESRLRALLHDFSQ